MNEPNKKTIKLSSVIKNCDWEYEIDVYDEKGEVNVDGKIVQVGNGFAPHGGIMLRNIYNQGFRMAYDIGIIGIYVTPNEAALANGHKTKFLVLGPPDFKQLDDDYNLLDPQKDFNPFVNRQQSSINFNTFPPTNIPATFDSLGFNMGVYDNDTESEIKVKYISNYEMFGKDSGYLIVEQKFIFTKYNDEPAHEPTGGLKAARLHPIIRLHFEKPKHETVESFRVDYRLYINLDSWNTEEEGRKTTAEKISNSAGVFRDNEVTFAGDFFIGETGVGNVIFEAAEKPLVAEIMTGGLINNIKAPMWDNLHWWGAGKKWVAGSTPGSFHAVHIHWRWGKEVQNKPKDFLAPDYMGEKEFIGQGYNGELTDPTFLKQSLKIAIVKNNEQFYNYYSHINLDRYIYNYNLFKTKNTVFGNLFKDINAVPKDISKGEDIVLYYSAEIKLSDCKPYIETSILDGCFFIHGLFFAHEIEKEGPKTGTVYSFYKNPNKENLNLQKPQKWERSPQ